MSNPCNACCRREVVVFAFDDLYLRKGATEACGDHRVLSRGKDGYCVFYDKTKDRCTVYPVRPYGCREIQCGSSQCRGLTP